MLIYLQDMQGGPLLAYEINVSLLQHRKPRNKPKLTLFETAALRNIITGAVHTQARKKTKLSILVSHAHGANPTKRNRFPICFGY